jgi:hypothetical protein
MKMIFIPPELGIFAIDDILIYGHSIRGISTIYLLLITLILTDL